MLREAKIKNGQSIYDLGNLLLGGMDNIFKGLILLNSFIQDIDEDLTPFTGQTIVYNDAYTNKPAPQLSLQAKAVAETYQVTGKDGQNIFDACIMGYGSLDRIIKLIRDSNLVGTNQQDVSFKTITFNRSSVVNQALVNVISNKGRVFTTLFDDVATGFSNVRILETGPDRITESGIVRIIQ